MSDGHRCSASAMRSTRDGSPFRSERSSAQPAGVTRSAFVICTLSPSLALSTVFCQNPIPMLTDLSLFGCSTCERLANCWTVETRIRTDYGSTTSCAGFVAFHNWANLDILATTYDQGLQHYEEHQTHGLSKSFSLSTQVYAGVSCVTTGPRPRHIWCQSCPSPCFSSSARRKTKHEAIQERTFVPEYVDYQGLRGREHPCMLACCRVCQSNSCTYSYRCRHIFSATHPSEADAL